MSFTFLTHQKADGNKMGPRSYSIRSDNGAVDAVVNAGPRARAIAKAMARAGAKADPGATYSVRVGYGRIDVVYEHDPIMTYLARPDGVPVNTLKREKPLVKK
jgi:hypothetical protein